tara:strand:- start:19334 stop:26446 length:7113 start_codon:yes stop_codon:yes gene_type:complete
MAIDLNVTPYYNDFTAAKKFNRVVFKPGVAVQARELTQLQDYMLNTIKEFGDYVFKDGATVRGGSGYPILIPYIKINDLDSGSVAVSNDTLSDYVGDTITGGTTGIKAEVLSVLTGSDTDIVKKKTLYLNYTKGNESELGTIASSIRFESGETLTVTSSVSARNGKTFVVDSNTDNASFTKNFYGYAIDFVIEEGIVYAQGKFIAHDTQKIRLDPFNMNVNYFVGIEVTESIQSSDDDTSLLDPATGAYNYNAPGADRTKVDTVISKVPFGKNYSTSTVYEIGEFISNEDNIYEVTTAGTSNTSGSGPVHTTGNSTDGSVVFKYFEFPSGFTALYKVQNGQISKKYDSDIAELAELGKVFAAEKRESDGDYVVEPFTIQIIEHLKTIKGITFNTSVNTAYAVGQFVNNANKLYEVTLSGTSAAGSPPTHTSGEVLSGTVSFGYRGASYKLDNNGYHFSNNPVDAGSIDHLVALVSPGIAYADGYRREFYAKTPIKIRKGTSTEVKEGLDVTMGYGNYFNVKEVAGVFNIEDGAICNIGYYGSVGSQTAATAVTDATFGAHAALQSTVGTCRVRALKRASGTVGTAACQYRLFVYDVKITGGTLKDARSIQFPNSTDSGFADIILQDNNGDGTADEAVLFGTEYNKLIYPTPWQATKTLAAAAGGTYDTAYYYTEEFNVTVASNGTFSLSTSSLGSGVIFPFTAGSMTQALLDNKIHMVCKTTGITNLGYGTVSGSEGRVARLTPAMVTAVSSGQSMSFDMGNPSAGYDAYLQVEVKVVDAIPVPKAINIGRYVKLDTRDNVGGANGPFPLGIVDVLNIEAVYVSSDMNNWADDTDAVKPVNYINDFILDNGQSDNFYGHARLIKKGSSTLTTASRLLTVKLSHFTANYGASTGTYFAKNSYPIDDSGASGIYTFEIPTFSSERLGEYQLRDAIDFRPRVKGTAVSTTSLAAATNNPYHTDDLDLPTNGCQFPTPNSSFSTDVEYYLPRVDKLVISKSGTMRIVEGVSSLPAKPPALGDAMQIAEIQVPPFPSLAPAFAERYGQELNAVYHKLKGQNKRYSMRDIGAIEKRINRLEYYLALSLMEMQAKDQIILDSNGNDRFKNGIYVNPFDSDLLSDLSAPEYSASYDSSRKRLGPSFNDFQVDLILNPSHGTSGWTQQGSMITRPYTLSAGNENRFATKVRNCVGELQFTYDGEMDVHPRSDTGSQFKTAMQKNTITSSNGTNIAEQIKLVNSSKDVVGFETNFEMGALTADNKFVVGQTRTTIKEAITIDGGGDASGTITGDVAGGGITSIGNRARSGWFEQVGESSIGGDIGGNIKASVSLNQTMEVSDIQQTTINMIQTAEAGPIHKVTNNMGTSVKDVSLLPNMSGNKVGVRVRRLKPNTRLYFFFDDIDQTPRCLPCDAVKFDALLPTWKASGNRSAVIMEQTKLTGVPLGGASNVSKNYNYTPTEPAVFGSPIHTDQNGDAAFVYHLPRGQVQGDGQYVSADLGTPTFGVGTRRMRVTDDPTDRFNFTTTSAEETYSAFSIQSWTQQTELLIETHTVKLGVRRDAENPQTKLVGTVVTDVNLQPGSMSVDASLDASIDATNPSFIHHPPVFQGDPIAQTFGIGNAPNGAFVKKVRVFFRDRPGQTANTVNTATNTSKGITCEIRKVLNGFPTATVLAGARKFLKHTEVKTTPDTSGGKQTNYTYTEQYATDFEFDEPIYVAPNEEYAFVLLPQANDPNYNIWVSKLGENKIGTTQRVTAEETTIGGMLFTSSNNRAWSPHQTEDIKYVVFYEQFTVGTGTVEFTNDDAEYTICSDYLNGRPVDGQTVHAFKVGIVSGGSGYSVNNIITLNGISKTDSAENHLNGSGVKLKVTAVSGGAVTGVEVIDGGVGFKLVLDKDSPVILDPNTTGQLSVAPSGASGATFSLKMKYGNVEEVDPLTEKIDITYNRLTVAAAHSDADRFFAANDVLGTGEPLTAGGEIGYNRNTTFKIASIYNKVFNNFRTNMTAKEFPEAQLGYKICSTNSAGASTAGTTFTDMLPVVRQGLTTEKAVYSASKEAAFSGGNRLAKKSYRHRYSLNTTTADLSPVLSLYRNSVITRSYEINNDTTNETGNAGNAKSKFLSRVVRLADGQEAEDVRLSVALRMPQGSSFKIYFKGQAQEDDGNFQRDLPWVEMEYDDTTPAGFSMAQNQFIDFNFKLPSTATDSAGVFTYSSSRVNALTIGTAGSGIANTSDVDFFISGGGTPSAQAAIKTTTLNNGGLSTVEIVNPGRGYGSAPTIKVFRDHTVSTQFAVNTIVAHTNGKIYKATIGGTSGAASPPTHTSGTATDGGITWTFLGTRPVVTATVAATSFKRFKYFSAKLVMLSTNTSVIPEAKQLRIIALQA